VSVKIRAQYTRDTRLFNGLDSIEAKMMADPVTRVLAVVVIEVAKTNIDHLNGGQKSITVNVAEIEPVFDGDAREARQLLERAYKTRTGSPSAPTLFGDPKDDPDEETAADDAEVAEARARLADGGSIFSGLTEAEQSPVVDDVAAADIRAAANDDARPSRRRGGQ